MQQRYNPSDDRYGGHADGMNAVLAAFEAQVRALEVLGLGPQAQARFKRFFPEPGKTGSATDGEAVTETVKPGDLDADGLELARLLQSMVACERRTSGWREKQSIQWGRAWVADAMKRAAKQRAPKPETEKEPEKEKEAT